MLDVLMWVRSLVCIELILLVRVCVLRIGVHSQGWDLEKGQECDSQVETDRLIIE